MSGTHNTAGEHLPALVPTPTPTPTPAPHHQSDDIDDRDLAAAEAEVASENSGASSGGGTAQPPARQPGPRTTGPAPAVPMIPKPRFDELAAERNTLRDENLYLKGALAARTQVAPGAPASPTPGAQPPTIQQQIDTQAARIIEASERFDRGELSMVEFQKIELNAGDVIATLRAQHLLEHVRATSPAQPGVGLADGEMLERHVAQMEAAHPWSAALNDNELAFLTEVARAEAKGLGRPFGTGPAETLRLRQAVAELSDTYGPRWYPNHRIAAPTPATTGQTPTRGVPSPTPSPRAAAGQRKIEMAARQPPNTATAGSASTGTSAVTEQSIEAMSEDEILALPQAVRDRLMNG